MAKTFISAVTIAVIVCMFCAGCSVDAGEEKIPNPFYDAFHQSNSFGFNADTFHQLQEAFGRHQPTDFASVYSYYTYACGYYHTKVKDESKALQYADSLLLAVNEKANPMTQQSETAIANLSKGDVLFALSRYNEACTYYYNGKVAAMRSGNLYTLSEYSYRLGMAMYRSEKYKSAAKYFANAFEEAAAGEPSFVVFYRRQEVLNNAALSYLQSNIPDSAVWFAKQGLEFVAGREPEYGVDNKHLMSVAKGVLYGTLGRAYLQMGDTTGVHWLQQSIAINGAPGCDNANAREIQLSLAQYYLDTAYKPQLQKAMATLVAVQRGQDSVKNKGNFAEWNRLMSRYHELNGNTVAAYSYLTRYNALRDQQLVAKKTLMDINIGSLVAEMESRYELTVLKNKNQLKTIYLDIAGLTGFLTAVILFLIVRSRNKEKRTALELTTLNKQIQQQKIQLEATVAQLDKQIKTKDYILRVIAHDLRNPISAISTLTRIVSEEYENEADNKEFLELAQSACKDSLTMIDSILQLSQHGTAEELRQRVFDVSETVLDCVELLRLKAAEKQQDIVLHTPRDPQFTFADADKIRRVVNNLVMNSIKFSFPNSAINVYVKDRENYVEIAVKDKGIGIPASMQDKVFDVFTSAKRKGTAKEGTFGLGLSICKQLVEAHEGKIWLESEEGVGTTFYVQLRKHNLAVTEPEMQPA